jgi:hypothetical protein
VPYRRAWADGWAHRIIAVRGKGFGESDPLESMQRLTLRAKDRSALEGMPLICVFCAVLSRLIDGESPWH